MAEVDSVVQSSPIQSSPNKNEQVESGAVVTQLGNPTSADSKEPSPLASPLPPEPLPNRDIGFSVTEAEPPGLTVFEEK